jgi:hypothetical protein
MCIPLNFSAVVQNESTAPSAADFLVDDCLHEAQWTESKEVCASLLDTIVLREMSVQFNRESRHPLRSQTIEAVRKRR